MAIAALIAHSGQQQDRNASRQALLNISCASNRAPDRARKVV
jgi:hypothetical protein